MLTRRILIALAAATLAGAAHAQPTSPPPPAPTTNPSVVLTTAEGPITIELYVDKAPITAKNFLKYVDRKLFDGATFYRASKPPATRPTTTAPSRAACRTIPPRCCRRSPTRAR